MVALLQLAATALVPANDFVSPLPVLLDTDAHLASFGLTAWKALVLKENILCIIYLAGVR